jgi:hypothetical protein
MDSAMFNPALGEVWVTTNGTTATCIDLAGERPTRVIPFDTGSQGFAFARPDGTMALGWKYYADVPRGLCVYTEWPDVAIGQGIDNGAVVRFTDDGVLRQFATGQARFPRIKRAGEQYACVFINLPGHETTITWLTRAELRAMKPVGAVPLPPPPPPEPPPVPVTTPNMRANVNAAAATYASLLTANTKASCGQFTEFLALDLYRLDGGWGLLSKQPGENQYNGHGVDSIIYKPTQQVVDILSNAGAREEGENLSASPTWQEQPKRPGNEWMPPFDVPPGDDDPPDVPPVSVSLIDTRNLQAVLKTMMADHAALAGEVAALKARPPQSFPTRIALRTDNGHYLCAEGGGGGEVNATRESAGGWETFTIESQ